MARRHGIDPPRGQASLIDGMATGRVAMSPIIRCVRLSSLCARFYRRALL
jgi:hypothetical protein